MQSEVSIVTVSQSQINVSIVVLDGLLCSFISAFSVPTALSNIHLMLVSMGMTSGVSDDQGQCRYFIHQDYTPCTSYIVIDSMINSILASFVILQPPSAPLKLGVLPR